MKTYIQIISLFILVILPCQGQNTSATLLSTESISASRFLAIDVLSSYYYEENGFLFKKNGITDPFDPITFPYLTTEKRISLFPFILFAAILPVAASITTGPTVSPFFTLKFFVVMLILYINCY